LASSAPRTAGKLAAGKLAAGDLFQGRESGKLSTAAALASLRRAFQGRESGKLSTAASFPGQGIGEQWHKLKIILAGAITFALTVCGELCRILA
jgi:hypothetical protein